jgi:hypothetical protein
MLLLFCWHFSHNRVQCHWNYISTYIVVWKFVIIKHN